MPGPDLARANELRRRARLSLELLAKHVESDLAWQQVRAFRGDAMLAPGDETRQLGRLAATYGFQLVEPAASPANRVQSLGGSLHTFAMTLAFNPAALPRQRFLRHRHELWISRAALLGRYGKTARK
jgi:hypothetical protein